jgi:hypothetical protein
MRTFVPRASYGIYALLRHLDLQKGDEVLIVKTFDGYFVSGCVTKMIEKVCNWSFELSSKTKAVLVIHEFGIPCKKELPKGLPIIEDCAWRVDSLGIGEYAVFSLQKMYNINYGAFIEGIELTDEFLWSIGCLDTFKRERALRGHFDANEAKRIENWNYYDSLIKADGMTPFAERGDWMPTVYLQTVASDEEAKEIVERLIIFGVQAGVYWGKSAFYLPIHQEMSLKDVEYMFAVVKGYFNSCKDYGTIKTEPLTEEHL